MGAVAVVMTLPAAVAAGQQGAPAKSAPAKSAPAAGDTAAIAKVRSAYQAALSAQDGAAVAKLYTPDGVEMPPNAPAAKGRAAIEAFHKTFFQQWMVHGANITATETRVTGDRAVDIGTYKQQLMAMKGGGINEDAGKYVVLLQKDASGAWWITHAIYNSDVPLPAAPPAKK